MEECRVLNLETTRRFLRAKKLYLAEIFITPVPTGRMLKLGKTSEISEEITRNT